MSETKVDSCVIVMKALMMGLRVNIGDYNFQYVPEKEEVFIIVQDSNGKERFLRTSMFSLNAFVRMVHSELTEEQRIKIVTELVMK